MYRNYNVVVWIPYGRKVTVDILKDHLFSHKDIVDEVWLCMNTDPEQDEDIMYAKQLEKSDPNFFKIKKLPLKKGEKNLLSKGYPKQRNTGKFYRLMTDPETIYIRMDDDLVYISDDYFEKFLDFRIDNPQYFITLGHIWNNSMISYLQQHEYKNIGEEEGIVTQPFAMDPIGWMSPTFAEYIHNILLDHIKNGTVQSLYFDKYELDAQRFSVCNFAHFGRDFARFDGDIGDEEEEQWLTEKHPEKAGVKNAVCGQGLVSHYAFFAQRPHLEANTDIRQRYEAVARQKLSDAYYKLLKNAN